MIEIRIHGRGGQGAVVASKILADAVFSEGKQVQAFPHFGVERRGAPVAAFIRIDKNPIRLRNEIYKPDHLVILDPTLTGNPDVMKGLKPGGVILINTDFPPEKFAGHGDFRIATVNASKIALDHKLGSRSAPIVNTAILGALARVIPVCSLDAIVAAISEGVPSAERNAAAARDAYKQVVLGWQEEA